MPLIDFILNIAGLLLWLTWLSVQFDPLTKTSAASLVGTLKKAGASGPKRWKFLAGLSALLLLRAVIYWEIGAAVNWTPRLDLEFIDLSFRSDYYGHMLLFSLLSFGFTLGIFYLSLLLLSMVNAGVPDADPLQRLVRLYFARVEGWPAALKLMLPFLMGGLLWLALHPLLARLAIVPETKSSGQLFEQAVILGLGTYLAWKYLIVAILVMHLLHSYVYLGRHPVWSFVDVTARNLLSPLRWAPLRLGRVDFLPLAAIALVFLVTEPLSRLPAIEFPPHQPLSRFLPF